MIFASRRLVPAIPGWGTRAACRRSIIEPARRILTAAAVHEARMVGLAPTGGFLSTWASILQAGHEPERPIHLFES